MYVNIRGIKGKRSSLIETLHSENPHIFLLTETLLPTNKGVNIDGYTFYGRARPNGKGGGTAILVRNDVKHLTTPHVSERDLEIIWIAIKRREEPLFIGCYYGKQESRCSKDEINHEMSLLSEDLQEYGNIGHTMLFMDGNGKIGLLGEEKSRNGKLLEEVFETHNLVVLNKTELCKGAVTRQNTKNQNEKSAIDFVIASAEASSWLDEMLIDEEGLMKISGKTDTDHNTILININLNRVDKSKPKNRVTWRLKAPPEKWRMYDWEISKLHPQMELLFTRNDIDMDTKYGTLLKKIDNAARVSIGKSTIKMRTTERFSQDVKDMRKEKRNLSKKLKRKEIQWPEAQVHYKDLQERLQQKILSERCEKANHKLKKITGDNSRALFWKERKRMNRDNLNQSMTVKDENGRRLYDEEQIKEQYAVYFEKLYKKREVRTHSHHRKVETDILAYVNDRQWENEWYNEPPTEQEITEIINREKNGKATTDIKNELLKGSNKNVSKLLTPLLKSVWETENIPSIWNEGQISSVWKGKGDRENLSNHRGITVSSSVGTILEEIIDIRMEKAVLFTQGQAGGKKGSSTCDHLFLVRAMMTHACKNKQNLFLTFYDVAKAYDQADVGNMLHIMWQAGIKGKMWRLLRNLSTNLTAKIKTNHGMSRQIKMENGGKQGSRLMCRKFSKQMDTLSENFIQKYPEGVCLSNDLKIGCLAYVDDIATAAMGMDEQKSVLNKVDEFAVVNKLEWGAHKCQVMQVGKKVTIPDTWQLGQKQISNTTTYKYLGDILTNDNKNKKNIQARENKIQAIIRQVNTTASSDIMRGIETKVIMCLYHKCIIPSLLNNAESWTLSKTEEDSLDKIGIRSEPSSVFSIFQTALPL